ncbi:hypothetical protein PUR61_01685, partial [Streptomyces sp. BE20]|uniref:hypothetical protein n=1 Tax=Streptomyces sp. BE20 TaxID=3002525 RepID=UPI002E78CEE1
MLYLETLLPAPAGLFPTSRPSARTPWAAPRACGGVPVPASRRRAALGTSRRVREIARLCGRPWGVESGLAAGAGLV